MSLDVRAGSTRWLRGSDGVLAHTYDVALLDLDGVVYVGPQAVPGAANALAAARARGMRLAFVTNNASRDPRTVADQLTRLGVPAAAGDVVTSAQAAAHMVRDRLGAGASVLVTGSDALRAIVSDAGLVVVRSADDRPAAVVQGFSYDLTYHDLAEAALAVRAGAIWVATNVDSTLPNPRGLLPGNGSLVAVIEKATGATPLVAGKPQLPLHAEAVHRTTARAPLVVGDRLDTDIEGANAAGAPSLLVLTGVTRAVDLLSAPEIRRPTYLAADLGGLLAQHPAVECDGELFSCRDWRASWRPDGGLEVHGSGEPLDGLRALLAATWSRADRPDRDKAQVDDEFARAAEALDDLGYS